MADPKPLPCTILRLLFAFLRALPAALEREHLRWALREIHPLHPDVPFIVRRINQLERPL